jgi:cell division protein FtsI (penicillin-binding protein 3)
MSDTKNIKNDIVIRLAAIYIGAIILAMLIIGQIFRLQFSDKKEYTDTIEKAEFQRKPWKPERGNITTYDGKILATSMRLYEVRLDFNTALKFFPKLKDSLPTIADSLYALFKDKARDLYYNELLSALNKKDGYFLIKKDVTYQQYQRLKTFPVLRKQRYRSGLRAIEKPKRVFPYDTLALRTIGSVQSGIGIEGFYNRELTGEITQKLHQKIGSKWIPVEEDLYYQPPSGKDIISTINIDYQDFAHNALYKKMAEIDADTGTVVLMEVKTGEIKAMVNLLRVSEGKYIEGSNYAVGMKYEPGSTFKLPALMAALEDGYISLKDSVDTGAGRWKLFNHVFREAGNYGYGKISVRQVFEKSSNVGTARLIYYNYRNHEEKFVNRLHSMNIGRKTDIDLAGEPDPNIPFPRSGLWSGISLPQMSIGYEVEITPLQLLNFFNAVANDGEMVRPRIVKAIRHRGKIIKEFGKEVLNPSICSKATLLQSKIMLEGVVEKGTASNISGAPYKIAGKTGTAQVSERKEGYKTQILYFGSFVGYFPADNPAYSCIVVIRTRDPHNFYGNEIAAPVFKKIADKVYATSMFMQEEVNIGKVAQLSGRKVPYSKNGKLDDLELIYKELRIPVKGRNNIGSPWVLTRELSNYIEYQNRIVRKGIVPLVIGMGLKDAVYLLQRSGLKVIVNGRGTVIEQSIEAGGKAVKNNTITITLG